MIFYLFVAGLGCLMIVSWQISKNSWLSLHCWVLLWVRFSSGWRYQWWACSRQNYKGGCKLKLYCSCWGEAGRPRQQTSDFLTGLPISRNPLRELRLSSNFMSLNYSLKWMKQGWSWALHFIHWKASFHNFYRPTSQISSDCIGFCWSSSLGLGSEKLLLRISN